METAIGGRKFSEAMRGYKKEEVDEYLSEIAMEVSQNNKEKEELNKKLDILANKIQEYREDEDALKEALLGAQKQGNAVIAAAKEKSAEMIQEAQDKCDQMIADAEALVAQKQAEAEKIIADALAEKQRIEDEATKKANDIHTEMEIQTEIDKEILARTKREAEDFRTRLIVEYTNHMEFIKKIPEQCEDEFIKETTADHNTEKLRELLEQQKASAAEGAVAEEKEDDSDIKVVNSFAEIPVQEAESEEVEETDEPGGFSVENAFGGDSDEDDDTPDFLKNKAKSNNRSTKYEKLEFGNNTGSNNNKKKRR